MFRLRRRRPAWAVPAILFLAILIVAALAFNLANLDTGGEAIPNVPDAGGTPPTAVGELIPDPYASALMWGFLGLIAVGVTVAVLRGRKRPSRRAKPFSWWDVLSSVIGLAIVLVLLLAWPRVIASLQGTADASNPAGAGAAGNTAWPTAAGASIGLFLAAAVFVAVLLLAYLLRRGAGPYGTGSDDEPSGPEPRWSAAEAVQSAIADLELGGDVRTAILACFQRFCILLDTRGITAQLALTPRELERLALDRLGVDRDASAILTGLFEEARYSDHALGERDRGRAIDSLERIRSALGA